MKNVTITMDEEVARWAHLKATERDTSLSRFVGEVLREKMTAEHNYQTARERYLARPCRPLKSPGEGYPRREELHSFLNPLLTLA